MNPSELAENFIEFFLHVMTSNLDTNSYMAEEFYIDSIENLRDAAINKDIGTAFQSVLHLYTVGIDHCTSFQMEKFTVLRDNLATAFIS